MLHFCQITSGCMLPGIAETNSRKNGDRVCKLRATTVVGAATKLGVKCEKEAGDGRAKTRKSVACPFSSFLAFRSKALTLSVKGTFFCVREKLFSSGSACLGSRRPACRNRRRRRCTASPFVSWARPTSRPVGDAAAARGAVGVSGSGRLATVSRDNPISRCSGRPRGRPSSGAACCRNVGHRLGYPGAMSRA